MHQKRVLIIDDDRQISEGAAIRLHSAGYSARIARNVSEGVLEARRDHLDAIVLDIRMPEMNGLEALDVLKNDPKTSHIPVVMLSASIDDEATSLDSGAHYFIRKPFAGQSLVEAVDAATETSNQHDLHHQRK